MDLEIKILSCDGKSAHTMADIFKVHHHDINFIDILVKLLEVPESQICVTWLLKAYVENGQVISARHSSVIIEQLNTLSDWEAKLHILQCMPDLIIQESNKSTVEQFLRSTLKDKNKFLRAWSYNGFFVLARQFPEYEKETRQLFDLARQNEAASVKARIRSIMAHNNCRNP